MLSECTHADLMILIDNDLQAIIDEPTTDGILVIDNVIFAAYGPQHMFKSPIYAPRNATYFYAKESSNGNHRENRTQVRPDADLSDLSQSNSVRQAVPAGNADTESGGGHQSARLHRTPATASCNVVNEQEWIDYLLPRAPLLALASMDGRLRFCNRAGTILAIYDPLTGTHYLTP